ncbi:MULTISPECIES: RNA polymerase sigma factor FliA [Piscirickettsiaceae]|jgi:RNA polymerase sigma factor for flagellar operon FliA|uniref:RNA polymerase sigma factor FliA n=1 Tax=Hydrogenovibrio thermophilus TaxID=265883 RepID=A0A410H1Z1_9GAMM|nr:MULTISPECIES: RNA polymerase sigma factor FliA [Piscirickettsiaceae]AZR82509.1 RNA polymerase sigma factor FliA [Thiomicrospira sp. S5]QAB14933.1 RNA polymerase sigma factor FliA [Hydrogenovibrio thermophilus]
MTGTQAYANIHKQTSNGMMDIEAFLPLVKRIAYHLKGRLPDSVMVDDLIQSGIIGLIEASQKFDAGQGASFETYAGIRIRGAMLDEIRKGDWTPRSVYRKSREVSDAINVVESKKGREARDEEVAEEMGITLDEYYHILQDTNSAQLLSIDEPDHDELSEERMVSGVKTPVSELAESGFQSALAEQINELPEKEKLVMALYYDEELNLKEIGEVLEVSESRVSQIHSQAIKRLKSRLKDWI